MSCGPVCASRVRTRVALVVQLVNDDQGRRIVASADPAGDDAPEGGRRWSRSLFYLLALMPAEGT